MRRTIFIFSLTLAVLWGFAGRIAAQEKDSTEEEVRKALEALEGGLEGIQSLQYLGDLKGVYGLEGLEGLEALKILGEIDWSSLDVADEYLDILEQCRGMLEDYEEYLGDLDAEDRRDHEVPVDQIRQRLDDNSYIDDPEKLIADLTETINRIKEIEREHKAEMNSNNPRCCRVIRNLRREMVIMVDLVEDYNDQQVEVVLNREEIKKYMEQALGAYIEAIKAKEEERRDHQREERVPFVVIPPSPPSPEPSPLVFFPKWSESRKGPRGEVGLVKRFEDSLRVTSNRPVRVFNSAGGVQITGWDEDFVAATLGIEVSSDSRTKEKEFTEKTQLRLTSDGDAYRVEARFPELSDPETKIIRCLLLVNIPDRLSVESDNSFGDVLMSDLNDGADVVSRHSSVTLENITGRVKVSNTMGKIALSDIRGDVTARTSYSPISIVGCDGSLEVENAYAAVTITDTRGPTTIKNSGQVIVNDHQGKLTIENTYGLVQLFDVRGDIVASNAYQPIEVSSVRGLVELDNLFSQISVTDIIGGVTASNSHGMISVQELEGPVVLKNKNGSVTLVLDGQLRGASSVTNSHGTVNLIVSDEPDLKILASLTDGSITSPITYQVDTRGNTTDAEWILGNGKDVLKIVGTSSNLVVRSH